MYDFSSLSLSLSIYIYIYILIYGTCLHIWFEDNDNGKLNMTNNITLIRTTNMVNLMALRFNPWIITLVFQII